MATTKKKATAKAAPKKAPVFLGYMKREADETDMNDFSTAANTHVDLGFDCLSSDTSPWFGEDDGTFELLDVDQLPLFPSDMPTF